MAHDHTAHEDLDRSNTLELYLALARSLVQSQHTPQLILAHRIRVINLVSQYHEWCLGQLLHAQQRIELGFRFVETLVVFGVDEEDDTGDFGEVVPPEASGLCVTTEIEGRELHIAY